MTDPQPDAVAPAVDATFPARKRGAASIASVEEALHHLESIHTLGESLTPQARQYRLAKAIAVLYSAIGRDVVLYGNGAYVVGRRQR